MDDMKTINDWGDLWDVVHDANEANDVLHKMYQAAVTARNDVHGIDRCSAEEEYKRFEARMHEIAKEVQAAYEVLCASATKDAALAEGKLLAEAAANAAEFKPVELPRCIDLTFLNSDAVYPQDVELMKEHSATAKRILEDVEKRIGLNAERLATAEGRIVADDKLAAELTKIEAERNQAVLDGADTAEYDKKMCALKGRMDALIMGKKLAAGDVELLRGNESRLHAALETVKGIDERLCGLVAAFEAHAMVSTLNAKIEELYGLLERFEELRRNAGSVATPSSDFGNKEIVLPVFYGTWLRPDGHGHFIRKEQRTRYEIIL